MVPSTVHNGIKICTQVRLGTKLRVRGYSSFDSNVVGLNPDHAMDFSIRKINLCVN